ncbi:hypothetical protein V6N13_079567 [Hibiscus sabdariffa]
MGRFLEPSALSACVPRILHSSTMIETPSGMASFSEFKADISRSFDLSFLLWRTAQTHSWKNVSSGGVAPCWRSRARAELANPQLPVWLLHVLFFSTMGSSSSPLYCIHS